MSMMAENAISEKAAFSTREVDAFRVLGTRGKREQPKFSQSRAVEDRLTAKAISARNSIYSRENWRSLRDSNPRPQD